MKKSSASVNRSWYSRPGCSMPRKLWFQWTGPFWITKEFNGSYQLGTLVRELLSKWINDIQLKPYLGRMPRNPFKEPENPRSTGGRSETGEAPEATDSVEPGPTNK